MGVGSGGGDGVGSGGGVGVGSGGVGVEVGVGSGGGVGVGVGSGGGGGDGVAGVRVGVALGAGVGVGLGVGPGLGVGLGERAGVGPGVGVARGAGVARGVGRDRGPEMTMLPPVAVASGRGTWGGTAVGGTDVDSAGSVGVSAGVADTSGSTGGGLLGTVAALVDSPGLATSLSTLPLGVGGQTSIATSTIAASPARAVLVSRSRRLRTGGIGRSDGGSSTGPRVMRPGAGAAATGTSSRAGVTTIRVALATPIR